MGNVAARGFNPQVANGPTACLEASAKPSTLRRSSSATTELSSATRRFCKQWTCKSKQPWKIGRHWYCKNPHRVTAKAKSQQTQHRCLVPRMDVTGHITRETV